MSKIIAFDFAGVVQDPGAPDRLVPGVLDFLRGCLAAGHELRFYGPIVYETAGLGAAQAIFQAAGALDVYKNVSWSANPPSNASLTFSTRAVLFRGAFPAVEAVSGFVPWPAKPDLPDLQVRPDNDSMTVEMRVLPDGSAVEAVFSEFVRGGLLTEEMLADALTGLLAKRRELKEKARRLQRQRG